MKNTERILSKNGLSRTQSRISILMILDRSNSPLSGREISDLMDRKCDKSTIHRNLNSLYEMNIIQRIIIDHEVKYALKEAHQHGDVSSSDHVHFKCSRCKQVFCLTELKVNEYTLPEGFTREENQFLIIGKCKLCQT